MSWLKKIPWLSLSLLWLTYGVFGWWLFESTIHWSSQLIEDGTFWDHSISTANLAIIIQIMGTILVLIISLIFIAPIKILRLFFGKWLQSDKTAFTSVLVWSFFAVMIICWLEYFVRLLVMLSAASLARLDLQIAGYTQWQGILIFCIISLAGFIMGGMGFELWSNIF